MNKEYPSYRHLLASFLLLATPLCAADPSALLGQIEFLNSGAADAQDDFINGMLYMHNFEYDEAADSFQQAREVDPSFAMAYWGEAMSYNHPLWNQQSRTTAEEILMKLGKTPEARAAKCGTQREREYLHAAEILFGMTEKSKRLPKAERDALFRDAMRRIHETYPDDDEATAIYGLSILGASYGNRNYRTYMQAAAVLTEVWDANRMHPGAAHYLIHSYDDPVHAPLGLPMARAYSKIAPAAAHAQHMTSHIFVAMGMWDDLVAANETALRIEMKGAEATGSNPASGHYGLWLQYGYLQQGRLDDARAMLEAARALLNDNPTQREKMYYGAMYARYMFDSEDTKSADELAAPEGIDIPSPHYHFARAWQAIIGKDLEAAHDRAQKLQALQGGSPEVTLNPEVVAILRKELESVKAFTRADKDKAIAILEEAAEDSRRLTYQFGPPPVTKPVLELLGEALLNAGRPGDAVAALEEQLEQTPMRALSLLFLARAADRAGDEAKAQETYRRLAAIWHSADPDMYAYDEVLEHAKHAPSRTD
jgi:tetratricopeptide (TPR) repeat protein